MTFDKQHALKLCDMADAWWSGEPTLADGLAKSLREAIERIEELEAQR